MDVYINGLESALPKIQSIFAPSNHTPDEHLGTIFHVRDICLHSKLRPPFRNGLLGEDCFANIEIFAQIMLFLQSICWFSWCSSSLSDRQCVDSARVINRFLRCYCAACGSGGGGGVVPYAYSFCPLQYHTTTTTNTTTRDDEASSPFEAARSSHGVTYIIDVPQHIELGTAYTANT